MGVIQSIVQEIAVLGRKCKQLKDNLTNTQKDLNLLVGVAKVKSKTDSNNVTEIAEKLNATQTVGEFYETRRDTDVILDVPFVPAGFYKDSSIQSISFLQKTKIENKAFENATELRQVDFTNVSFVGNEAFIDSGLSGDVILTNQYDIGEKPFSRTKIRTLTISGLYTLYSTIAFINNELKTISLSGTTNITAKIASQCNSLTDIYLPNIVRIDASPYSETNPNINLHLGEDLEEITSVFFERLYGNIFFEGPPPQLEDTWDIENINKKIGNVTIIVKDKYYDAYRKDLLFSHIKSRIVKESERNG